MRTEQEGGMEISKMGREGERVCVGEDAKGQCVLNDHLKKQACKSGSEFKRRRVCFDSSSIHCFCKSRAN